MTRLLQSRRTSPERLDLNIRHAGGRGSRRSPPPPPPRSPPPLLRGGSSLRRRLYLISDPPPSQAARSARRGGLFPRGPAQRIGAAAWGKAAGRERGAGIDGAAGAEPTPAAVRGRSRGGAGARARRAVPYIGCQRGARRGAAGERDGESPGQRSGSTIRRGARGGRGRRMVRRCRRPARGTGAGSALGGIDSLRPKIVKKKRKIKKSSSQKPKSSRRSGAGVSTCVVRIQDAAAAPAPLPPGPQRRSRRRARWLAPARPRWLLCGRGARAGPLASGGAIGCRPSCASLDTLAAPRGTGRCANTGSSFRALKGTRTPVAPYGNAGSPRAPRRYEAPCLSPTLPAPWERGCGAAPPRPPPGKSRS